MKKIGSFLMFGVIMMTSLLLATSCGEITTPPEEEEVVITVSDITDTSAKIDVKATNENKYYISSYIDADSLKVVGEKELANVHIAQIEKMCTEKGMSLADYVTKYANKGSFKDEISSLESNILYRYFVIGIDNAGVVDENYFHKDFMTAEMQQQKVDFAIAVTNITTTEATVTVTPTDNDALYFFFCISEETLNEKGSVKNYIASLVDDYLSYGTALPDVVKGLASTGTKSRQFTDLDEGTNYVAFAVGINGSFVPNSEVRTEAFTTVAVEKTDITFTFETIKIGVDRGSFRITPSLNDVAYIYYTVTKTMYATFENDEELTKNIISYIKYNALVEDYTRTGESEVTVPLMPDEEYFLVAFSYNEVATSDVAKYEFKAGSLAEDPCAVTFNFVMADDFSKMTITPSEDTWYTWDAMLKSDFEELSAEGNILPILAADLKKSYEYYTNWGFTREQLLSMLCNMSEVEIEMTKLKVNPGDELVFYVFTVDVDNITNACDKMFVSEPYTIPGAATQSSKHAAANKTALRHHSLRTR